MNKSEYFIVRRHKGLVHILDFLTCWSLPIEQGSFYPTSTLRRASWPGEVVSAQEYVRYHFSSFRLRLSPVSHSLDHRRLLVVGCVFKRRYPTFSQSFSTLKEAQKVLSIAKAHNEFSQNYDYCIVEAKGGFLRRLFNRRKLTFVK